MMKRESVCHICLVASKTRVAPIQGQTIPRLELISALLAKSTSDELQTVVTEAEATLNSRPLSYVSTEDLDEPLIPSHLIVDDDWLATQTLLLRMSEIQIRDIKG